MVRSVAVIGVGAMGAPMAERILSAGFELLVCDGNEEALVPFYKKGVQVTTKPSDCCAADLVLVLVATAEQVKDVVAGENGIVSGLVPPHSPVVAVMSTTGPDILRSLQQSLGRHNVRLIDAPISGGALRAEVGSLTIIMGGEDDDIDFARPVMESLGTQLFHCGPVGAAQTVKIINNILGIANTHFAAEAYRLALDHGLSVTDTAAVLEASTGRNYLSENAGEAAASFARWAGTRREFDSLRSIMLKDLGIALELTSASQGSYPVTERLMSLVGSLGDETFDNWRTVGAAPAE